MIRRRAPSHPGARLRPSAEAGEGLGGIDLLRAGRASASLAEAAGPSVSTASAPGLRAARWSVVPYPLHHSKPVANRRGRPSTAGSYTSPAAKPPIKTGC